MISKNLKMNLREFNKTINMFNKILKHMNVDIVGNYIGINFQNLSEYLYTTSYTREAGLFHNKFIAGCCFDGGIYFNYSKYSKSKLITVIISLNSSVHYNCNFILKTYYKIDNIFRYLIINRYKKKDYYRDEYSLLKNCKILINGELTLKNNVYSVSSNEYEDILLDFVKLTK